MHESNRSGFTIIEVVLVLAIAGLVFLMVFIALPAMQRSQRDTQRRDQLSMLMTQLAQYQANNRNKLPKLTGLKYDGGPSDTPTSLTIVDGKATGTSDWDKFYNNYLTKNGAEPFEDPNGTPYTLTAMTCNWGGKPTNGALCRKESRVQNLAFADQYSSELGGNVIIIVTHAFCDGEDAKYTSGASKVAVLYKLEGGGAYCSNN